VREVEKSHLNYVVADTKRWEQSAAYYLDKSEHLRAFAKNAGLGFAIPYLHNGQMHDYMPDFIVRLNGNNSYLILETKGYDPLAEVKKAAAERWVSAVNADGTYGHWAYRVALKPTEVETCLRSVLQPAPVA
ncbi:MAG TPA: type III restriction endonuclease subunit R, partial [Blastocatellia bacterium]